MPGSTIISEALRAVATDLVMSPDWPNRYCHVSRTADRTDGISSLSEEDVLHVDYLTSGMICDYIASNGGILHWALNQYKHPLIH